MKFMVAFVLLLSSVAFAQNTPGPRLMCSFVNGTFKVFDGAQKYERYVGGSEGTLDCGRDYGALVAGPRFVTYFKGNFQDKYVGGNGARSFMLRGHLAVAVMSSYLIVAKAGGQIVEKYISGNNTPVIELSSSLGIIANNPYLLFTDGTNIVEKYVGGNMNAPILVTGRNVGGALVGSYLIVYNNGSVTDKYIGSRTPNDTLVAGRSELLGASIGNYFYVYDAQRSSFKDEYVGGPGRVEVREEGAYITLPNGRITRYNLLNGSFESI
ncbi:MAG: hypothetical protein V4598_10810 [Bdellovibrionota bacterium]